MRLRGVGQSGRIGGTGKYEGASGGGTYTLEELTDTLMGGRYKGTVELP
jgi:hypothetical protein